MKSNKSWANFFHTGIKPNVFGIIAFAILLAITCYFSVQRYKVTSAQEEFIAYTLVNEAKNRMQDVFTQSISATELLGFLATEYDAVSKFDSVAPKMFSHLKYIDAIELVPKGVICCVYPIEGNESVIGYNIMDDVTRNREAFEAISRRELYFAGPFELRQGGIAVVGRLPIFKDNEFWGFSAVVIRLSTLLKAAQIDRKTHRGFLFQLSKINPNTGQEEFFLNGDQNLDRTYTSRAVISSGEWILSATRLDNSQALKETYPIFALGLLLSFTGAAFVRGMSRAPHFLGRQLDESEKKYRKIFENTSEGIFRSTIEGKLILANPSLAKIFDYSTPEEFLDGVSDIGHQLYAKPEDREKMIGELLLKGSVSKMEIESVTRKKRRIWISINAHVIYDEHNKVDFIEGTITDITVRKNDKDKLSEQFDVLMKYAFINSHEVRAHVATLLGLANLITEDYIAESERDRVIKLIAEETEALDRVIRGLSTLINEVDEYR